MYMWFDIVFEYGFFGSHETFVHFKFTNRKLCPNSPLKPGHLDTVKQLEIFDRKLLIMMSQVRALQGEPEKAIRKDGFFSTMVALPANDVGFA